MITHKTISKLALMTVAVVVLTSNGCSVILTGMGALSDASKPNQIPIPGSQVDTIKPGAAINVVLKDGSRLSGKYMGLERIPSEQYAAHYSQAREQRPGGILLPALGDSINIGLFPETAMESVEEMEGTFEGFERDRILIKLKATIAPADVPLSTVTNITRGRGHIMCGETAKRLILEGWIPVWSAIAVKDEAGKTLVALDKVSKVIILKEKKGAMTGFAVGVFIDAVVVFVIIGSLGNLGFAPTAWGG